MTETTHRMSFSGRLILIGFGSIGQGVLPLLLRHLTLDASRITLLTADDEGREIASQFGLDWQLRPLTRNNYRDVLTPLLQPGDLLINLSVNVGSIDLIALAHERGVAYLDTCIEPWAGGYTDPALTSSQRSNYALRESMLALRRRLGPGGPTAITTHGANPGLVSHFAKQALLDLARDYGLNQSEPSCREDWAALAQALDIRVIHIAERDTQVCSTPRSPGEFVNTWSIDGFVGEGCQPAELGWGSHERHFPEDGRRHDFGTQAAIYLERPGASTRVRTWTPLAGPLHGFLITHAESISIADFLTVGTGAQPAYRPTVHYAYHPCDDAVMSLHEFAGREWCLQPGKRLIRDEIIAGTDELGVLLLGPNTRPYWYGSRLDIDTARHHALFNNATSLQVTAAVLAGVLWVLENPRAGILEPDELPHTTILTHAAPYLGELIGVYGDWSPLDGRERIFPEDVDPDGPWQFKNFRVI